MEDYTAYIDESGDPGISGILPGGSAWFLLSCVLVRTNNIPSLNNTHTKILGRFKNCQTDYLHFNKLLHAKKLIACEELSNTPCRLFVAVSNKSNIQGYWKKQIEDNRHWLYWWMTRILMEKVTDFCERHAQSNGNNSAKVKFVFSRRGGNSYSHLIGYLQTIKQQTEDGTLFVNSGSIRWGVVDFDKIIDVDPKNSKGLQMADIGAGAFFNALETGTSKHCTEYANKLIRILAPCNQGRKVGFGLKVMPSVHAVDLTAEQKDLFTLCGYRGRWSPGS